MASSRRPEFVAPPEVFYGVDEAAKYTRGSRVSAVQARITNRALELLNLPSDGVPRVILDLGCGSGLSGDAITSAGHRWVGLDVSQAMLDTAIERGADGDVMLADMGQGLGLRDNCFDGAISISAIQWLCNADKSWHDPRQRLKSFFKSLYRCLTGGARAVLQFYPSCTKQAEMISSAAMKAGFTGGLVVDFPHSTRAKKYYLTLMTGGHAPLPHPRTGVDGDVAMDDLDEDHDAIEDNEIGLEDNESEMQSNKIYNGSRRRPHKSHHSDKFRIRKGKDWVIRKKAQRRLNGLKTARDSKYTGRKRKAKF